MTNKHYIFLLFFFTILSAGISVFLYMKDLIPFSIITLLLTIVLFCRSLVFIYKIFQDVQDFTEAIKYRDFSKVYPENKGRRSQFYKDFNLITNVFLSLSKEKEAQYHYLRKMLELVDTGIFAYNIDTKEVLWMNDALKSMFNLPALKNVNWLKNRNEILYNELINIPLGDSRLVSINLGTQSIKTLTNACKFQTDGNVYKLIAFHNISKTLEDVEAGAWKGLLNVMTHEIMNSIAPVASLADTLKKRMETIRLEDEKNISPEFEEIEFAMETIRRRSEGLLNFADMYRSLSKTIIPQFQKVRIYDVVNDIYQLMKPSLNQKGISLELKSDNIDIEIEIDRNLIEQVLINFITNATYAVKESLDPEIILFPGITQENQAYLTVADNGCGIPSDIRDKIFIPFFSTKKQGSGIGLSLSREIIKLHKGRIQIQSKEGEGSAFTILFEEN